MTYDQLNKLDETLTDVRRALRIADHFVFDDDSLTDFGIAKAMAHLTDAEELMRQAFAHLRAERQKVA